jgi:hypothetical protein
MNNPVSDFLSTPRHNFNMPLKSIEEERLACEAAFAAEPNAVLVWCCHHEIHLELLREPAERRINYILTDKPEDEQAARFRNFRPARNLPPELTALAAAFREAWAAFGEAKVACREAAAAYHEASAACDEAWAAWRKAKVACDKAATACREAWAACDEAWAAWRKAKVACDKAWAAWREAATAYREADTAYDTAKAAIPEAELKRLHDEDWPDNTWNGKSIFKHGIHE